MESGLRNTAGKRGNMNLDYESKKWAKELKNFNDFKKQTKGVFDKNEQYTISVFLQGGKKDYLRLYDRLSCSYEQMARWYYLDYTDTEEIKKYTYLSGMALVITKILFDKGIRTDYKEIVEGNIKRNMDFALYQLIAADEFENVYTKQAVEENNLVMLMYNQKWEEAGRLLEQLPDNPEEAKEIYYVKPQFLKKIYMAIIAGDEKAFNEELAKRIKKYRRNMVGYSTIIDIVSVALIKMAKQAGLSCHVDVIEIPGQFFDASCRIDKNKVRLPFWQEFLEEKLL